MINALGWFLIDIEGLCRLDYAQSATGLMKAVTDFSVSVEGPWSLLPFDVLRGARRCQAAVRRALVSFKNSELIGVELDGRMSGYS
jgi:hypothetical protein